MVYASNGIVEGRTTLQKWGGSSSAKTKLELDYEPYFYGPYSRAISRATDELIASDFLIERGRATHHRKVMYTYTLTNDGEMFAKDLKKQYPELYKVIKNIVEISTRTVGNNINILSWAAKVY